MFKTTKFFLFGAVLILLCSCQGLKEEPDILKYESFSSVLVPAGRLPLFADLTDYVQGDSELLTKSDAGMFSLEGLIDSESSRTEEWKEGITLTQIPFLQNKEPVYASVRVDTLSNFEEASQVKKFLVIMKRLERERVYVVTLIAKAEYYRYHQDFDFLNRPNYSGVALFSSVEGKLLMMRSYRNGQILPARALKSTEKVEPNDSLQFGCVTLLKQSTSTKSGDEWITPSYCIAFRYMELTPSYCFANGIFFDGSNWHTGNYNTGGGISGGSGNDLFGDELPVEDVPEELSFTVRLSHYCPYEHSFPGENIEAIRMLGGGEYVSGSQAVIDYLVLYTPLTVNFSYWTGDFDEVESEMPFLITVLDDVQSTAYFDTPKPCSDESRRITNPLVNMSIAASSSWGNYRGGTYGNTRKRKNGTDQWHDGIDLLAPIGTPVYAVRSGIITRIESNVSEDETKGFGNEILITSERDDNTDIILRYAHLQSGNAVAINPRTGVPFVGGDRVNRGDIIGYTGRSGNAYNVPNKHLHLGVQVRGVSGSIISVNPADYINGTINVGTINATHGRIDDIACD